ncbi:hypothetical protein E4Q23_17945 [Candidatus Accumulibacter phosphatis]|uniref:Uncharacterized protein n=1 Tax=Candidatus Accumulibacter phosphatis TaxID=327160 RepID=A0ABX1U2D3_9PROT|nr:hypothetical protein [Candidatus Accumulibacter phosphatis]NMQ29484.1 hypothetical protein [Candidatus Accumulibacter phosphatis]
MSADQADRVRTIAEVAKELLQFRVDRTLHSARRTVKAQDCWKAERTLDVQGSELRVKGAELRAQGSELHGASNKSFAARQKALRARLRASIELKNGSKDKLRERAREALRFARKDQSLAVQTSMPCTPSKKACGNGFLPCRGSAEPCPRKLGALPAKLRALPGRFAAAAIEQKASLQHSAG